MHRHYPFGRKARETKNPDILLPQLRCSDCSASVHRKILSGLAYHRAQKNTAHRLKRQAARCSGAAHIKAQLERAKRLMEYFNFHPSPAAIALWEAQLIAQESRRELKQS